jgi:hypothetical protein
LNSDIKENGGIMTDIDVVSNEKHTNYRLKLTKFLNLDDLGFVLPWNEPFPYLLEERFQLGWRECSNSRDEMQYGEKICSNCGFIFENN